MHILRGRWQVYDTRLHELAADGGLPFELGSASIASALRCIGARVMAVSDASDHQDLARNAFFAKVLHAAGWADPGALVEAVSFVRLEPEVQDQLPGCAPGSI